MSLDSFRSANSNSKSKRSLHSSPSDSGSSKNGSKKRKSNQKTLGAAWGANSLSSSRSSFRKAPFSDFGSYMVEKNKKLHCQYDAEASSSSQSGFDSVKPIFEGVSIFVDGFTIPSSQELRGYMLKHGGHFENYFSRRGVTHVICSNLPKSKIKNLRSFSGLPVVKPTWVLDSVAAKKLLSWIPYQLDQLVSETANQPKLSAFFSLKSSTSCEGNSYSSGFLSNTEPEDLESGGDTLNHEIYFKMDEPSEYTMQRVEETTDPEHKHMDGHVSELGEPALADKEILEMEAGRLRSVDSADSAAEDELVQFYLKPSASSSDHCPDKHFAKGLSALVPSGAFRQHSTTGDPNFVENYFKSSRLHFIGMWRNRYRKRYGHLSNGAKHTSSQSFDVNASINSHKAAIIHIDMDCFFVAVVVRNRPELWDQPVAVCHSDSPKGTAEISSANYPARNYGVKAGMFVRDAKVLCPHLVIVPYNFEAYEEVGDQFYNILHRHCNKVQAVSCDEAFLDVTDSQVNDPELLASMIRKEICETTGCTASAGIAGNILMARLATRSAKPNGQCYIPLEKVDEYLLQLPIKTLPGIGRVLEEKLKKRQVQTCGQLRMISKESLQKDIGAKTGEMLWNYCRGIDNRLVGVIQENKSVGAEVNWGVRFKDMKDVHHFLPSLCKEVSLRLQGCGVQGRTFTLKIKERKKGAEEPSKYMGCGDCENLSHSTTIAVATDDVDVVQRIAMQLFGSFNIDPKDIRGIGLQVTKLENTDCMKQGHTRNSLRSWLVSASPSSRDQHTCHSRAEARDDAGLSNHGIGRSSLRLTSGSLHSESQLSPITALPLLHDLDIGVIEGLPPELFSEINDMYGGKLNNFISKNKGKAEEVLEGGVLGEQKARPSDDTDAEDKAACCNEEKMQVVAATGFATAFSRVLEPDNTDLMPSSLSQLDMSVLKQLPEELRADVVGALPPHRRPICLPDNTLGVRMSEGNTALTLNYNMWNGHPPYWVDKFKVSDYSMLSILANMYFRSGSSGQLSLVLQCFLSETQLFLETRDDMVDEVINSLSELMIQYIKLKLDTDIEDIYVSFRLLKRLTLKSQVFLQVYKIALPYVQESVGEIYGGNLRLSPAE